jgi:hypothetical protein
MIAKLGPGLLRLWAVSTSFRAHIALGLTQVPPSLAASRRQTTRTQTAPPATASASAAAAARSSFRSNDHAGDMPPKGQRFSCSPPPPFGKRGRPLPSSPLTDLERRFWLQSCRGSTTTRRRIATSPSGAPSLAPPLVALLLLPLPQRRRRQRGDAAGRGRGGRSCSAPGRCTAAESSSPTRPPPGPHSSSSATMCRRLSPW